MAVPDRSQEVLKNITGRDISFRDVNLEMRSDGPREIIVAGVGEPPPNFAASWVERDAVQAELLTRISSNPVTEIVAAGGFGKSWLAAWAFAELENSFDKRLWVNFRRELWQDYGFDRFARWILQEIGSPLKDPTLKENVLLRELVYQLADPNRPVKTLVVMDNLESLHQTHDWLWFERFLNAWTAQGRLSRVVVTTRPAAVMEAPLPLGGLLLDEGAAFLQREGLTGERFAKLIDLAAGHPLLLKIAAAWVKQTQGATVDGQAIAFFSGLFEQYRGNPASLAEAKVEPVFKRVFKELPESWQLLLLRVSVYRLPFSLAMAQAMGEAIAEADLQGLVDRALLVAEGDRFTLHALIAELVRKRISEAVLRQAHEQAIAYYEANYQPWDRTIDSCKGELEAFHHACALGQYSRADQILARCDNQLDRAGYWRDLLPLYETLVEQWEADDENETRNLGWAWTWLGNLHQSIGEIRAAIHSHQQAQRLFQSVGRRSGEAASLCHLGIAYNSLGQYQKAIDFQQQSLKIEQEIGNLRGAASSHWSLNKLYVQLGRIKLAMHHRHQAYHLWHDMQLSFTAVPLPSWMKNRYQSLALGDDWAEQLCTSEKRMAWLLMPLAYLSFTIHALLRPFTSFQKNLKIPHLLFWFALGIALVILITWLR